MLLWKRGTKNVDFCNQRLPDGVCMRSKWEWLWEHDFNIDRCLRPRARNCACVCKWGVREKENGNTSSLCTETASLHRCVAERTTIPSSSTRSLPTQQPMHTLHSSPVHGPVFTTVLHKINTKRSLLTKQNKFIYQFALKDMTGVENNLAALVHEENQWTACTWRRDLSEKAQSTKHTASCSWKKMMWENEETSCRVSCRGGSPGLCTMTRSNIHLPSLSMEMRPNPQP